MLSHHLTLWPSWSFAPAGRKVKAPPTWSFQLWSMLPASAFMVGAQEDHKESFLELPKNILQYVLQIHVRLVEAAVFGKQGCGQKRDWVCVCEPAFCRFWRSTRSCWLFHKMRRCHLKKNWLTWAPGKHSSLPCSWPPLCLLNQGFS